MSTIKFTQVNQHRIAQERQSPGTETQPESQERSKQPREQTTAAVRALKNDGVEGLVESQKVGKARVTVGKDGEATAQTAAALGEGSPLTMSAPSKADLRRASQGAAPSWRPLPSFPVDVLEGLSFAIPAEMTENVDIPGGKRVGKGAGQYVEHSLEELLTFRRADPEGFKRLVQSRGGEAVRVVGSDGVELNPFSVEVREEWVNAQLSMVVADADLRAPTVESGRELADDPQGEDPEGDNQHEEGGTEEGEPEEQDMVLLSNEPLSLIPATGSGLLAQLRSLHLADEEELRSAVLGAISLETSASGLSAQSNGQFLGTTNSVLSFGAEEDLSGIPIEDLIFLFFMSVTESSEEKLRNKMAEAAEQEALEAETGEYSGEGKSATTLASEVQMLMHEWRQLTEMSSNLMKTMHDMAMTPIRNLR